MLRRSRTRGITTMMIAMTQSLSSELSETLLRNVRLGGVESCVTLRRPMSRESETNPMMVLQQDGNKRRHGQHCPRMFRIPEERSLEPHIPTHSSTSDLDLFFIDSHENLPKTCQNHSKLKAKNPEHKPSSVARARCKTRTTSYGPRHDGLCK